jgi:SAM-dependent methyltransferase
LAPLQDVLPPRSASKYPGGELELFRDAVNWKRYWAALIRPDIGHRVLEVGAGIGGSTAFLRRGDEARWVCLEPDRSLADRLRAALPDNCELHCGTLTELQQSDLFDTILYIDVLEHIEDDAGELRRAAARLLPQGRIIVLAPAWPLLHSAFDAAVGHHRRYTRPMLNVLTPPATRMIRAIYADSVGLLTSLANRLLLRESLPSARQIRIWDRVMVPASRFLDVFLGRTLGKTVIAIWQKDD